MDRRADNPAKSADYRDIAMALSDLGLLREGEQFAVGALSGGISCDVFRVEIEGRACCVKRALPKLRVAADWRAPVERARSEVEWIRLVAELDRRLVPEILGEDRRRHLFVMPFYPPDRYPVWKGQLAAGNIDRAFAAGLGKSLARIHAATAGKPEIAEKFALQEQFLALRLEPYLLHTANRHPDVAARLQTLAEKVASARIALMHGDFSPKNILCGPDGPMILDAETACYGDPAFDLAFCLNHLLLKCVWHPEFRNGYLEAFDAFRRGYFSGVMWEREDDLDRRATPLLAALMLARIDGKSPVEYLTNEDDRNFVRHSAKHLLLHANNLDGIRDAWRAKLHHRA